MISRIMCAFRNKNWNWGVLSPKTLDMMDNFCDGYLRCVHILSIYFTSWSIFINIIRPGHVNTIFRPGYWNSQLDSCFPSLVLALFLANQGLLNRGISWLGWNALVFPSLLSSIWLAILARPQQIALSAKLSCRHIVPKYENILKMAGTF